MLLLVLLWAPAAAFEESAASNVRKLESGREDVVRVWHEPASPEAGTQWRGGIEFRPGHAIGDVKFQICRVGVACFAPPTDAQESGPDAWTFNTAAYVVPGAGRPVTWEAGWRIGVRFVINETLVDGRPTEHFFPAASDSGVLEDDYFAFNMAAAPQKATPAPAFPSFAIGLLVSLLLRRP